ncbi:MAG: type II secretion system major pseudopilin GspG [bacterium]
MKQKRREGVLRDSQQGFTLIELLVVMIIIGLLATLVGPKMFKQVGQAKIKTAKGQIAMFETALDAYRLDVGRYPERLQDLVMKPTDVDEGKWFGPYLRKEIPKDPWDNEYHYARQEDDYVLQSYGADGQPGGDGENADIPEGAGMHEGSVVPAG